MDIFAFITLGGGLAMFLFGMDLMGAGLKGSSAGTLKTILSKITGNTFTGFLFGLLITAIIQSSTATIVICVGLLGAGILNLKQTICIAMGANVGTTITAQIIRLLDVQGSSSVLFKLFTPDTLAPVALIVGIILTMVSKKDVMQNIGKILVGFGILFVGLMTMTDSMEPLAQSKEFQNILMSLADRPIIILFVSIGFTALIQSSSASVGVLQTLCSTGLINFRLAYLYVMGAAIGTCIITSIICSLGTKADARRVSLVNIIFNITGIGAFIIVMEILYNMGYFPNLWTSVATSGVVANFQTIFKFCNAVVFLPFVPVLMKIACKVVKDDAEEEKKVVPADKFDTHLFRSPALAIDLCEGVIVEMAQEVSLNFKDAMGQLADYSKDVKNRIYNRETYIDELTDRCSQYLIELSPHVVSDTDSETIGDLLQALSEFERIGDLSINVQEIAERMNGSSQCFSDLAKKENSTLSAAVGEIIDLAYNAFSNNMLEQAVSIEPLEEVIDDLVDFSRDSHIERLKAGKCTVEAGIAFLDVLTNLERISDQCSNLALLVVKKFDPSINKHEYIAQLHKGENEVFNTKYDLYREKYYNELEKLTSPVSN